MLFDYTTDYVMEDDTVRLIPLSISHVDPLLPCANRPEIWHYLLDDGKGRKNLTAYLQAALNDRDHQRAYPFSLFNKQSQTFVGTTRLYQFDPVTKTVKIGHTWLCKRAWGKGINKRVKYLLFEFAFEQMHVERIGFGVSEENVRSLNALERIGCQKEGVLRNFLPGFDRSGRSDLILLGILKEEWNTRVKEELGKQIYT